MSTKNYDICIECNHFDNDIELGIFYCKLNLCEQCKFNLQGCKADSDDVKFGGECDAVLIKCKLFEMNINLSIKESKKSKESLDLELYSLVECSEVNGRFLIKVLDKRTKTIEEISFNIIDTIYLSTKIFDYMIKLQRKDWNVKNFGFELKKEESYQKIV